MTHSLRTGEFLRTNEYLIAPNNSCFLRMQGDGNLCLYEGTPSRQGRGVWCALNKSWPKGDYFVIMQGDGNLVVYQGVPPGPGKFVWATGTLAPGGKFIAAVENPGLLTVSTDMAESHVLWASRKLRLLTFNAHIIEGSNIVVGATYKRELPVVFRDEQRYQFILDKIKNSDADIVAIQEIWSKENMDRIMRDLHKEYPHAHRGNSGSPLKAGSGLVMVSKIKFADGQFHPFSGEAPDEDGWATKGVLRCTLDLHGQGGHIDVGISHFWTKAGGDACTNAQDMIRHTIQGEKPAILMGDFNIHRRGNPKKFGTLSELMEQRRAVDSWSQVHGPEWTEASATDDQANNTLAQFFSPDRNTPNADCIDYVYLRNGDGGRSLRPIRAQVLRDWHFATGESSPPWYWVHEGTSAGLPAAATFGDDLCVVTRSDDVNNALQVALFNRRTKRWNHAIIRDAKGGIVEAHGSPGLVWYDNRLHLFFRQGLQVYKMESLDGKQWSPPQSQGEDFLSSGGVCAVLYRNTIYAFIRDPTGGAVYFHKWTKRWEKRERVGINTLDDISAAVIGDVLCVVCKDNSGKPNTSSGVMRAVLDLRNKWEVAQVGNSITCGGAGVTSRNGRFEVYFREANCRHPLDPRFGGMIHRRSSTDGKNWDGEVRLALPTNDFVCPIGWDNTTLLFFPFYHTDTERLRYKRRALAHGYYPQTVQLDASDHYPYMVDIVWPG